MPVLKTLVDSQTKSAFRAHASNANLSESDLLRSAVIAVLGATPKVSEVLASDAAPGRGQLTVRMAEALLQHARVRAKAAGMSSSRWIAALVQSNLTPMPVMTDTEIEALRASNRELAAIARSMNGLEGILSNDANGKHVLNSDQISELRASITENRETIHKLIQSSQRSWGVN